MIKRDQVLDIQRLVELGNWIENVLQKRTSIELFYSWPMAFYNLHHLLRRGGGTCGIFNILGILATGQLAMCGIGVEVPELCYGQLGEDRLERVWCDHPTLKALRLDLPGNLEGVCRKCILKQECLGSCVANNYHQSGHVTEAFWFCQQAEDHGFFPAIRLA
jgi:radical SAM protein with 4Fe4S-binding SPASM domain